MSSSCPFPRSCDSAACRPSATSFGESRQSGRCLLWIDRFHLATLLFQHQNRGPKWHIGCRFRLCLGIQTQLPEIVALVAWQPPLQRLRGRGIASGRPVVAQHPMRLPTQRIKMRLPRRQLDGLCEISQGGVP